MIKLIKVKFPRPALLLIFFALFCCLSGCGGSKDETATGTGTVIPSTVDQSSLTLSLTKLSDGTSTAQVSGDSPTWLTAVAIDIDGSPVVGKTVTFTPVTSGIITFNGSSDATGTALTNSSGVATIIIYAVGSSGATDINALVTGATGNTISGSTGVQVQPPNLHLSSLTITPGTIPAGASAAVSITVLDSSNNPYLPSVPVSFTSYGAAAIPAKATITSQVYTTNGVASATYKDINYGATDTITATLVGTTLTKSGPIIVNPASAGSIMFVSATPTNISLPGTGGTTSSTVVFKVVDTNGDPIQRTVDFVLDTTVGTITLSTASAPSDPITGLVQTIVHAGTVHTSVRVSATIHGTSLTSTSDKLVISTGIPTQNNISLAATRLNMEAFTVDGEISVVTARLADRFQNPVPDGTAVAFTASGGSIEPSCVTTGGACSVNFVSQEKRPRITDPIPRPAKSGRVVIMAYALGEESFVDTNGNGVYNTATDTFTDMPEPFLDVNENGIRDQNEPFIDSDSSGTYSVADGNFNGVLRDTSSGATTIHVRDSLTIVLSTHEALITVNGGSPIVLAKCVDGTAFSNNDPVFVDVIVTDLNGNTMPEGTTINFVTTNGTIISPVSFVVGNCSMDPPASYTVLMQSDATQGAGPIYICSNSKTTGVLQVTVRSKDGTVTYGGVTNVTD